MYLRGEYLDVTLLNLTKEHYFVFLLPQCLARTNLIIFPYSIWYGSPHNALCRVQLIPVQCYRYPRY